MLALLAWALAPAAQAQVDTHAELWSAELTVGEDQDMDPRGYCESSSRDTCNSINELIDQNHGFGALTDDDFVRGGVRHGFRGIFWFDTGRFAGDLFMPFFSDSMAKADFANWTLHFGDRSYELSDADNFLDEALHIENFFDSANPSPATGETVTVSITGPARAPGFSRPSPAPAPLLGEDSSIFFDTTLTVGAPEGGAGEAGYCRNCTYVRDVGPQNFGLLDDNGFEIGGLTGGDDDIKVVAITWDQSTLEFQWATEGSVERYLWQPYQYRNVILYVDDRPFPLAGNLSSFSDLVFQWSNPFPGGTAPAVGTTVEVRLEVRSPPDGVFWSQVLRAANTDGNENTILADAGYCDNDTVHGCEGDGGLGESDEDRLATFARRTYDVRKLEAAPRELELLLAPAPEPEQYADWRLHAGARTFAFADARTRSVTARDGVRMLSFTWRTAERVLRESLEYEVGLSSTSPSPFPTTEGIWSATLRADATRIPGEPYPPDEDELAERGEIGYHVDTDSVLYEGLPYGALTDDDFVDDREYTVRALVIRGLSGGRPYGLLINLNPLPSEEVRNGWTLHFGDLEIPFSLVDTIHSDSHDFLWANVLDIELPTHRQEYAVKITKPLVNYPATGDVVPTRLDTDPFRVGHQLVLFTEYSDRNGKTRADNGRDGYAPAFQWVRVDPVTGAETDIPDATGETYTVRPEDEGKRLRMRLSYVDDKEFAETLVGSLRPAHGVIRQNYSNDNATGEPVITGTAEVGHTLSVSTSGLDDPDGLASPDYRYQWVRVVSGSGDIDIFGATDATYRLTSEDQGANIKVRVRFDDDADNAEERTSDAYPSMGTVAADATVPVLQKVTVEDATVTLTYNEALDTASTPAASAFTFANRAGATTESDVVVSGRTVRFTATPATPFGDETGTLTYVKPSSGAIRDPTGNEAAAFSAKTVDNILNSAATGAPGLTGAARVGATLTVSTGDIADANGLSGVSWRYRWILDDGSFDTDVGTNATTYTVAEADLGRRIRARVEFTDDDGHAEAVETAPVPVRAMQPAAVCPAPVLAGRTEVWRGTVTVAPRQEGSVTVGYGYYTDPSTLGALSDNDFSFGMVDYTVQAAAVTAPAPGELRFDLDRALSAAARRNLRLHVCGETYAFAQAGLDGTAYGWSLAGLDWSGHGTRDLVISSAPNSAATGAPAVSGVARVGETVSANTDGITDADGLTGASFSYQWIQVDGTTETDIAGQTGRTYTLAAADAGKQLKVRVEFTDDQENAESLTSTAFPATGAIVAAPGAGGGLWSATLTVKDIGSGARGCNAASGTNCATSSVLTENNFSYVYEGANRSHGVSRIALTGGNLEVTFGQALNADEKRQWTLVVGESRILFSRADYSGNTAAWLRTGLAWTAGNDVELSIEADTTPPSLDAGYPFVHHRDWAGVFLGFDEDLDSRVAAWAPRDAFELLVNGNAVPIDFVGFFDNYDQYRAAENEIEIAASSYIYEGETVVLRYTDPTARDDKRAIQDFAGNDVPSFEVAVDNRSELVWGEGSATDALVARADGGNAVELSWEDGSHQHSLRGRESISGYRVEYRLAGETRWLTAAENTGSPDATHRHEGLDADTHYEYRIAEIGELRWGVPRFRTGEFSNVAAVKTADVVAPLPRSARVLSNGTTLELEFDEAMDVDNRPAPGAFDEIFDLVADDSIEITVGSLGSEPRAPAKVLLQGLSPAIRAGQTLRLRYTDPTGMDDAAALQDLEGNDVATFREDTLEVENASTLQPEAPDAPAAFKAVPDGPTRILLSWDPPEDPGGRPVTVYVVEISEDGGNTFAEPGDGRVTDRSYTHEGLAPSTERHYQVHAINAVGAGERATANARSSEKIDGRLALSAGAEPVAEGATALWTVTATTERDEQPGAAFAMQVRVASSDGTASAGEDYTALDATVSFAQGDFAREETPPGSATHRWVARKTGEVAVTQDAEVEPQETFALALSRTEGGDAYVIDAGSVDVAIADDDAWGIEVTAEPNEVAEGRTREVTLTARVTPAGQGCVAGFPFKLRLAVSGTAVEDEDYTLNPAPGEEDFPACRESETWQIDLSALLDGDVDAGETVTFTPELAEPVDPAPDEALLVAAEVTITEVPRLVLDTTALTLDEGEEVQYTLRLATQPEGTVTVNAEVSGVAQLALSTDTLTFTTTNWHTPQPVDLTALHDADDVDAEATVTHTPSGADEDYAAEDAVELQVTVEDDDASEGELAVSLSDGTQGASFHDPPPPVHFGAPVRILLTWSHNRTENYMDPSRAIGPGRAIRLTGGTARPVRAANTQPGSEWDPATLLLELQPDTPDADMTLVLAPLDCAEDDPAALCAWDAGHRRTGLSERRSWHVRAVTAVPGPPGELALSKDEDCCGDELVVTFAADEEATHYRMEYRNAGSTRNYARKWTGEMSPQGIRLVIDDIDPDIDYEVQVRLENPHGAGEWAEVTTADLADRGARVEQITTHGMRARVRYDRDLDPESRIDEVPSAYKVSFGGAEPESDPRPAQAARIEGREVVLTLPSWPADRVWVSYEPHRPQLAKYRLRDAQGIDAPAFDFIEASPAPKPRVLAAQTTSGPGSNGRWDAGEMVRAEVRFSAPVTVERPSGASGPTLELNLDGARREAAYEGGSGTEVLLFALPVSERDAGARNASVVTDGLAPGGSRIRGEAFGRNAELGFDGAPYVTGVEVLADASGDGRWSAGESIEVRFTFSEAVRVDTAGGTPVASVEAGGTRRTVAYRGGSGTARLVFARTLGSSEAAVVSVRVAVDSLSDGGGAMTAAGSGLAAVLTHPGAVREREPDDPPEEPAVLSIADAKATEGPGAALRFIVTLSRAATSAVRVDYETRAITATAGQDYVAVSGTLVFAPGDTSKSLVVEVLDDIVDDNNETLVVVLDNVQGAQIGRSTAVGTIENSDPIPRAWLSRFGRTASVHTLDAIRERVGGARRSGADNHFTLGGRRVDGLLGELRAAARGTGARDEDERDRRLAPEPAWELPTVGQPALAVAQGTGLADARERAFPGSAGVPPATGRRPAIVQAGGTPALPGIRPRLDASARHCLINVTGDRDQPKTNGLSQVPCKRMGGIKAESMHRGAAPGGPLGGGYASAGGLAPGAGLAHEASDAGLAYEASDAGLGGPAHPAAPPDGDSSSAGLRRVLSAVLSSSDGRTAALVSAARPYAGLLSGDEDWRALLTGSTFDYTHTLDDAAQGPGGLSAWSAWGRGAVTRFSGADGLLSVDGEVATATVGADAQWDRWLAGVAVSYSHGEGTYAHPVERGEVTSRLASVNPYASLSLDERTSVWGALGYGTGDMTVARGGSATPIDTGLASTLAAFGTRGVLARSDGGFELAAVSDALYTETRSDAARGLVGAGSGATSRVRLMLEGTGSVALRTGGVFEPKLEAALRYDGGDAETGAGVEVGAGLGYTSGRLSVQVNARGLLAHEDDGYEERGVGGSLSWRPGRGGRGWALELASGRGATESTVQGLWSQADAFGLSRDTGTHAAGTETARRFRSELSYGVLGHKRGALWVPYIGAETSAAEQLYRVGLKLTLGTATAAGLEYTRRSTAGGREPEGAMRFDLSARW